ncbi:MAG: L-threonylcarbamoyladenylate synthase [Acidilobaceae archaeon]
MVETIVLRVNPAKPDIGALEKAAQAIREGGLVAFPTETVYGLGASAFNEDAVRRIYYVKGRPLDNPIIVHICDYDQLNIVSSRVPEIVYKLIKRFWPGPLTLVLPKSLLVPYAVTAGLETVAVRMPAHPIALELIRLSETPIAAPSANISGKPSPTRGEHVIRDLYSKVEVIIDGGETLYGVESTIINLLVDPPILLRPGAYPVEDIENVLGVKILIPEFARGLSEAERALAPGMKHRHYAPDTPLVLVESRDYVDMSKLIGKVRELVETYKSKGVRVAVIASSETISNYKDLNVEIIELGPRSNTFIVAKKLFNILRGIDELNVGVAIVEGFEDKGLGLAIMNRLRKASTTRYIV